MTSNPIRAGRQKSVLRSQRGVAQMVEFSVGITIVILGGLLPFLAACGFVCSLMIGNSIAARSIAFASKSTTYDQALFACVDEAGKLAPLGRLTGIEPCGGYNGSGVDLFVDVRERASSAVAIFGPNKPISGVVDRQKKRYQYRLVLNYSAGPLFPTSNLKINYLSSPVILHFTASKIAEHPEGLSVCEAASALHAPW